MPRVLTWLNKNRSDFIGLVGLFLGILGPVTGYWFYRAGLAHPFISLLDIGAHPRLMNMSAVSDSPIRLIRKDGSSVMTNVYLARLYMWNSGNVVRHKAILSPLGITANGVEILDPKAVIVHRAEITGLVVKKSSQNSLSVDFALLEPGDGCALNVLYAADKPTRFFMTGTVLGVKSFVASETLPTGDLVLKTVAKMLRSLLTLGLIFAVLIFVGAVVEFVGKITGGPKSVAVQRIGKFAKWTFLAGLACALVFALFVDSRNRVLSDPANFVPKYLMSDTPPGERFGAKTSAP